jgi:hypothetical protein
MPLAFTASPFAPMGESISIGVDAIVASSVALLGFEITYGYSG